MTRLPGWLDRLHAYVEDVRHRPYEAVRHNCALFAAGGIQAITGLDPVAELGMARPGSELAVARLLRDAGGVEGLAARFFGRAADGPLTARRGDVVIKPGEAGNTLGICMGDHALFLTRDRARPLQARRLDECAGSWRVG